MPEIYKIIDSYSIAQANMIRNKDTTSSELRKSLYKVGSELGKRVIEKFCLKQKVLMTPMECEVECTVPDILSAAVITTKDDMRYFGTGLTEVLGNCTTGYMDFQGHRGLQALNSPVREIEFVDKRHTSVSLLIIGKSVLATGCTAVSLTKAALHHFVPEKLIIVSVFYSVTGLVELRSDFPNADIFVIGEPDSLTKEGLLIPGVGLLDERLK